MTAQKKISVILINVLVLSVVFGLINNKIKWAIHDAKVKPGSIIMEYFDIKEDILMGLCATTFVYVIYGLMYKLAFKRTGIIPASLILASISYAIPYLIISNMAMHSSQTLWISILPFFIIGLLLPILGSGLTKLFNKAPKL